MRKEYERVDEAKVLVECKERIHTLLMTRFYELENMREAINDRYPFKDLFVKWEEIDCEEDLIRILLNQVKEYKKYDSSLQ